MSAHCAKALWRCRRGVRELDLLLQGYLKSRFEQADSSEREAFLALLELPDDRLACYLFGLETPDDPRFRQIVAQIRTQTAD